MRMPEDDNHCSVFWYSSMNSNGNILDREGRLVSCEHSDRRVVRTESRRHDRRRRRQIQRQEADRRKTSSARRSDRDSGSVDLSGTLRRSLSRLGST